MKIDKKKYVLALANAALSGKEVSRISGVSEITISRIVNGVQLPRPSTLGRIARALNVRVVDLIETEV